MKFINLLGDNRFLINVDHIVFIEKTEDGCMVRLSDGRSIKTNANYDDFVQALE